MANPNPKLPKRKKRGGHGRNPRGGNQKKTTYDMGEARASLGLPADASFTQVLSHTMQNAPNPPPARSPLKKIVKARLAEELKKNELLSQDRDQAMMDIDTKSRHISTLKQQVRALSDALQSERKKSRATIAKLLDDAEGVMAEACDIKSDAHQKMSVAEQKSIEETQKFKTMLSTERTYYTRELHICKYCFPTLFTVHVYLTFFIHLYFASQ